MLKRCITAIISASMLLSGFAAPISANAMTDINVEQVNRGLVAMKTNKGVYLSWRLNPDEDNVFGSAQRNVSFNIYRDGKLIAREDSTTNYTDTDGSENSVYTVQPVYSDGNVGNISENAEVLKSGSNYFDIPLTLPDPYTIKYTNSDGEEVVKGSYSFKPTDCSVGDLDGDGEYEIVVKLVCNEIDVSKAEYSGVTKLAAYKLDGTRLWENDIDLGINVFSSAHTAQFLVYDFDNDGKAEITCQTAPGSMDAVGNYVSSASVDSAINSLTPEDNANADYRTVGDGRVTDGAEYLTIFRGSTGEAVDTINYPTQRYNITCWGKSDGGNRSLRFLADVAYLDGEKPYAVYWRGYYNHENGRTGIAGISFDGSRLSVDYKFDTLSGQDGYTSGNELYAGEGNHNITVADVDGDGKDEIISGALCMEVNDNGKLMPRWCTFKGHGDALHIGDYDPTHEGYEFFTVHEEGGGTSEGVTLDYGCSVIDASTGEILFHKSAGKDTGRGIMANVGAGGYYQISSSYNSPFAATGNNQFEDISVNGMSQNFRIFWDGDLYDELLDDTNITSWDGRQMTSIFNASGCISVNDTKSNPSLTADILGDWREEVIYPLSDNSALRVFISNISTEYKMKTLMSDGVYRSGVAAEQTTYNQPPHIGYYMDLESFKGEAQKITITSKPAKTQYYVGDEIDMSGLTVTAEYSDKTSSEIYGYTLSEVNTSQAGKHSVTVTYEDCTASFDIEVISGFEIDNDGYIAGWSSTGETSVILPDSINGITVKGFAANSLTTADFSDIYIYNTDLTFADGAIFADGVTIYGYTASTAEYYAEKHNISWYAIDAPTHTTVTFDEPFYSSYRENGLLLQTSSEQSVSNNELTYYTHAAASNAPWVIANNYGFRIAEKNSNAYLNVCSGIYDNMNQFNQVYMTLNKFSNASDIAYATVSMDIRFPTDTAQPYMELQSGDNIIDTVSASADGLSSDTWYKYTLVYDSGSYSRSITASDGTDISSKALTSASGTGLVNTIAFKQGFVQSSVSGTGIVDIDNLSIDIISAAKLTFSITAADGTPLKGASVLIGGKEYLTDTEGKAYAAVEKGEYSAKVSMKGYNSEIIEIKAFDALEQNIALSEKENSVIEIQNAEYASGVISDNEYNSFKMIQDMEAQSKVIGDITYSVGNRSSGGDGATGFTSISSGADSYLLVGAGRFNSGTNRNAALIFNNAPILSSVNKCVFKTDIYFVDGNNYDMTVKISDGSTTITSFDVNVSDKLLKNTWYTYTLEYADGVYTESFTDKSGNVVYTASKTSSANTIGKIDFNSSAASAGEKAEVYLKDISLYVPVECEVTRLNALNGDYAVTLVNSGSKLTASLPSGNISENKLMLINAVYSDNGELQNISVSEMRLDGDTYTGEVDYKNELYNKVMVWNNFAPIIQAQ